MDFKIVVIVPTGIAAEVGGYGGDASSALSLLSGLADEVFTHPNVVNAAGFYTAPSHVNYVEGYYLDLFFQKQIGFRSVRQNNIGLVIDRRCQPYLNLIENAVNATVLTTGGVISGYRLTTEPMAISFHESKYGFQGQIEPAAQLLDAAHKCLDSGAEALAVITYMDILSKEEEMAYLAGKGVDPIGATEALISHYLASELKKPVAHSPIFEPIVTEDIVDPRVAAEEIGTTFLPCLLMGLNRAPQLVDYNQSETMLEDISALIIPRGCMGGIPMLSAVESSIPVIIVEENHTCLEVTPESLSLPENSIYRVKNYLEAAGLLLALKQGIDPASVCRPYINQFKEV